MDGVTREALVAMPEPVASGGETAKESETTKEKEAGKEKGNPKSENPEAPRGKQAAPLVFVFHGHGGSMRQAALSFRIHLLWPEAVTVYPQGLNTVGALVDPEGKRSGWQSSAGEIGDRDLKFYDTMLASFKKEGAIDENRIYVTGHSNGGVFTYLLWGERGDALAAVAPSGAIMVPAASFFKLKPKPAMLLAGENDRLVKFAWQKRAIEAVKKLDHCGEGQPWNGVRGATLFPSQSGNPVVTLLHPGGHVLPSGDPQHIVGFFKEQRRP